MTSASLESLTSDDDETLPSGAAHHRPAPVLMLTTLPASFDNVETRDKLQADRWLVNTSRHENSPDFNTLSVRSDDTIVTGAITTSETK